VRSSVSIADHHLIKPLKNRKTFILNHIGK
jgi:hypothetical protein